MEFLMLIPIAAFIYGWVKSNPAVTPSPDLNPVSLGMAMEDDDVSFGDSDDTFVGIDTDDMLAGVDTDDTSMSTFDSEDWDDTSMPPFASDDWDGHTLADDLMYDPAYSWNSTNIYHHDD